MFSVFEATFINSERQTGISLECRHRYLNEAVLFLGAKKSRLESVTKDSVTGSSTESIHSKESSSPTTSPVPGQGQGHSHGHKREDSDTDSLLSVDSALSQRVGC